MSVVVIGATGHLGRLVVESLLDRGVPAGEITATGRATERLADLAERGVGVLRVDLDDRAAVDRAVAGADRVLLISGYEPHRVAQHRTVIESAAAADVRHFVYTSGPRAATTTIQFLGDHRATEDLLSQAGLAATVLRNAWYIENYTSQVDTYRQHGMVGAAGQGRVSVALRAEYAEAAAAVLTGEGHQGRVYELGGPGVTLPEIAAAISETIGDHITYTNLPLDQFRQVLAGAGVPAPMDAVLADIDRGIGDGELLVDAADLEGLLGRPATPLLQAVRRAIYEVVPV
jgi:NAD(P)H dehydrogenase (quinone)